MEKFGSNAFTKNKENKKYKYMCTTALTLKGTLAEPGLGNTYLPLPTARAGHICQRPAPAMNGAGLNGGYKGSPRCVIKAEVTLLRMRGSVTAIHAHGQTCQPWAGIAATIGSADGNTHRRKPNPPSKCRGAAHMTHQTEPEGKEGKSRMARAALWSPSGQTVTPVSQMNMDTK